MQNPVKMQNQNFVKAAAPFWNELALGKVRQTFPVSQTKELLEKLYAMPVTAESTAAIRSYEAFLIATVELQRTFNVEEANFQMLWNNTIASIETSQGGGSAPQLLSICAELRQERGNNHYKNILVKQQGSLPNISRQVSASARVETVYPIVETPPQKKTKMTSTSSTSGQRRSNRKTVRK